MGASRILLPGTRVRLARRLNNVPGVVPRAAIVRGLFGIDLPRSCAEILVRSVYAFMNAEAVVEGPMDLGGRSPALMGNEEAA